MKRTITLLSLLIIFTAFTKDVPKDKLDNGKTFVQYQQEILLKASIEIDSLSGNSTNPEKPKWTEDMKSAFVKSCTKTAKKSIPKKLARTYCECMLEKIVARYPNPKDVSDMSKEETEKMAKECIGADD